MFLAPFLLLYGIAFFILLAFLFALLEIGVIHYAFGALGLPPELAFMALFASLLGSYVNIPIARVHGGTPHPAEMVSAFGVRYRVPARRPGGSTIVAINVGGAIVPILVCIYVLSHHATAILPSAIGAMIVAIVVNRTARPIPGLGIATPMFVPPIVAALAAYLLAGLFGGPQHLDAIAYVSGVVETLVGADLVNLRKIGNLGAPVASIGGAGTFDGVFLSGIVAVLLA